MTGVLFGPSRYRRLGLHLRVCIDEDNGVRGLGGLSLYSLKLEATTTLRLGAEVVYTPSYLGYSSLQKSQLDTMLSNPP